jgi:hypothetical protein
MTAFRAALVLLWMAAVGGILFLATYLLVLSLQANGSMKQVLLGARRADA